MARPTAATVAAVDAARLPLPTMHPLGNPAFGTITVEDSYVTHPDRPMSAWASSVVGSVLLNPALAAYHTLNERETADIYWGLWQLIPGKGSRRSRVVALMLERTKHVTTPVKPARAKVKASKPIPTTTPADDDTMLGNPPGWSVIDPTPADVI